METINNYKLIEFIQLTDEISIHQYLTILDLLQPLYEIDNPKYIKDKTVAEKLPIKALKSLSFGQVTETRNNFNESTFENIIECVKMVTDLESDEILNLTILEFYGIISNIKQALIEITNMELNELSDDDSFDINLVAVNAHKRMSRFGVLAIIDNLANGDILKWLEIEKLPYLTVFTKLVLDKEKNKIQQELAELQRKNKST